MTDEKDARLTRQLIREELDASNSYEEKAQATSDPEAAKVYRDISREEKVHAGELQALLDREDPESTEAMKEGMEETGLTGSFKDIFDRKREDYIHKSMYGVHFEKKVLNEDEIKQINQSKVIERQNELASQRGQIDAANAGFAFDPEKLITLGDLLFKNYVEGHSTVSGLNLREAKDLYQVHKDRDQYEEYDEVTQDQAEQSISPAKKDPEVFGEPERKMLIPIVGEAPPTHADAVRAGEQRVITDQPISMPQSVNGLPYEDFIKYNGDPNARRAELNIAEAAARTSGSDTEEKRLIQSELVKQKNVSRDRPLQTTSRTYRGGGTDYDLSLDSPEFIGPDEVNEYVKRDLDLEDNEDENGRKAPSSAKRAWLTWRYFGKYGNIPKILRKQVKDEQGNPVYRYIGVPGANGQILMRKVPLTEIVMNYRFSMVGKDRLYDQSAAFLRTVWDPNAFNPATGECTGAFIPEGASLDKKGDVIEETATRYNNPITEMERANSSPKAKGSHYEIDPLTGKKRRVGDTLDFTKWGNMDQWEFYNMHCAMQALANGVRKYMTDPAFKERIDAIPASEAAVRYQNEVTRYLMSQEDMKGVDAIAIRNVVGKVSTYYDDYNKGLEAQRKEMSSYASAREARIEGDATNLMMEHLHRWIEDKDIKGINGEDVDFNTLSDFYDDNTGTLHLTKGGQPFDIPLQNVMAWADHQVEHYSRQIRKAEYEDIKAEREANKALEERRRIEDQHIEDYIRKVLFEDYSSRNDIGLTSNAPEMIGVKANLITQALLYGDGTAFQQFMGGDLEPGLDPREYLLKKANFNWDNFVSDRELLRQRADLGLAIEVGRMSDPKFHEAVAEAEVQSRLVERYGVAAALVSAQGNDRAFEMMKESEDASLESAMQAYMNRSKASTMYSNGKNIADMGLLLRSGAGQADEYKRFIRDRLSKDPDFQTPENEEDWEGIYSDMAGKGMDKALWNAVSNVKDALNTDPEFEKILLERKGALKDRVGQNTIREFIDTMRNSSEDQIVDMIKAGGGTNDRLLMLTLNGSHLAKLSKSPEYQGLRALRADANSKGIKFNIPSLKEGAIQLVRKINNALQGGARESYAFDNLREISAKEITKMLLDGNLADMAYFGKDKEPLQKAQDLYNSTLDQLVKEAMLNRAKMAVDMKAPREPKPPSDELKEKNPEKYNKALKRYNDLKAKFDRANEEYLTKVEAEYNALLNDPEKMARQREVMRNLAAQKIIPKIVKKPNIREGIARILGNRPEMMVKDNYSTLVDEAHYTDEDFLGRQKDEPTMEEQLQKMIAPYEDQNESVFREVTRAFIDRGYPEDVAMTRAKDWLKARRLDEHIPEVDGLFNSAEENITSYASLPDIMGEGESPEEMATPEMEKLIKGALQDYFIENWLNNGRIPKEIWSKLDGKGKTELMYKTLANDEIPVPQNSDDVLADEKLGPVPRTLLIPLRQDVTNPKQVTGYAINWKAFSDAPIDESWINPDFEGGEGDTGQSSRNNAHTRSHPEYAKAREILQNYIQKKMSHNQARGMGFDLSQVQGRGFSMYESKLDGILRRKMVDNLKAKLKDEGMNATAAGNAAQRMVDGRFEFKITSESLKSDPSSKFMKDMAEFGITPQEIQKSKYEAMHTSNAPYFNEFIKPYFEGSGSSTGDEDENMLKLFEGLSFGDDKAFQQNPALTEYWNKFLNAPGKISPEMARSVVGHIGRAIGHDVRGRESKQNSQNKAIDDYYENHSTGGMMWDALRKYVGAMGLEDPEEYRSQFKQYLRGIKVVEDPRRFWQNILGVIEDRRSWGEKLPDVDDSALANMVFSKILTDPRHRVLFAGHEVKQFNARKKAREEEEKKEKDATQKEEQAKQFQDTFNKYYQEEIWDSFISKFIDPKARQEAYSNMGQEEAEKWLQEEATRLHDEHYDNLVADHGVEEANKIRTADMVAILRHAYSNALSRVEKDRIFGADEAFIEDEKTAKKKMDEAIKGKLEDFATKGMKSLFSINDPKIEENKKKAEKEDKPEPVGGKTDDYTEGVSQETIETGGKGGSKKENKQFKQDLGVIAEAPPGEENQVKDYDVNASGKGLKVEKPTKTYNLVGDANGGTSQHVGRDEVIVEEAPVRKDPLKEKPQEKQGTGFQASAFDTPFADILSTKRTQAIRKTETGTVISPEGVSTPMTEQTSAPQEQNSVETGGFAELMKSKMASTHMMEEPSEEREDWIPMRNGYRRVTIGSGKDCVRSMMRNPPRSANAPGTRTRKV